MNPPREGTRLKTNGLYKLAGILSIQFQLAFLIGDSICGQFDRFNSEIMQLAIGGLNW